MYDQIDSTSIGKRRKSGSKTFLSLKRHAQGVTCHFSKRFFEVKNNIQNCVARQCLKMFCLANCVARLVNAVEYVVQQRSLNSERCYFEMCIHRW